METQVVQVRAREISKHGERRSDPSGTGRYICGFDPVTKEPYVWYAGEPTQCVVPTSIIAHLEADPWLDVHRMDARTQAARRMELALLADKEAVEAETKAKQLREKADMLFEEAQSSLDAAASDPLPEVKSPPTPGTDQLLAALPDNVRKAVEEQKLSSEDFAKELLKSPISRLAEDVLVSKTGAYQKAVAQAFPNGRVSAHEQAFGKPKGKK